MTEENWKRVVESVPDQLYVVLQTGRIEFTNRGGGSGNGFRF